MLGGRDRFRVVNALPMRMAGTHQVRLLSRMLSLSHEIVVYRLLNVWSWAAGAWRPGGTWGEVVPAEVIDQLVGRGAAAAMARAGLGIELVADGVPAVRLVRIDGAPDLERSYRISAQRRVAAAGRWRAYHEQRAARGR